MFTYSAICDVPEETLRIVTGWLLAHRREIGTRVGRRAGSVRDLDQSCPIGQSGDLLPLRHGDTCS